MNIRYDIISSLDLRGHFYLDMKTELKIGNHIEKTVKKDIIFQYLGTVWEL